MSRAKPWLWAADDPSVPVGGESGNANLLGFVCDGCFDDHKPRRYEDVRRLNDGLRERGRDALICYLCGPGGLASSPEELSGILLLDVEAGIRETASRIEEAIGAVQTFIRRARMGLEPGWHVSGAFAQPLGLPVHQLPGLAGLQAPRTLQGELDRMGGTGKGRQGRGVRLAR